MKNHPVPQRCDVEKYVDQSCRDQRRMKVIVRRVDEMPGVALCGCVVVACISTWAERIMRECRGNKSPGARDSSESCDFTSQVIEFPTIEGSRVTLNS